MSVLKLELWFEQKEIRDFLLSKGYVMVMDYEMKPPLPNGKVRDVSGKEHDGLSIFTSLIKSNLLK